MKKLLSLLFLFLFFSCGKSSYQHDLEVNNPVGTQYFYINSPSDGLSVLSGNLSVSGISSDKSGVIKVEVIVTDKNSIETVYNASGTQNWSASVTLSKGKNLIRAKATRQDNSIVETADKTVYWNWERPVEPTTSEFYESSAANVIQIGSKLYIHGGEINGGMGTKMYSYDMSNPSQKPILIKDGINPRYNTQAIVYLTQMVLLGGWKNTGTTESTEAEYINITNGNIAKFYTIDQDHKRGRAGVVLIGNKGYLIGGWDYRNYITNTIFEFNLDTGAYTTKTGTGDKLYSMQAFVYNNKIYIFGGFDENGNYNTKMFIYDPSSDFLGTFNSPLKYSRCGASVVLNGNKAYIIGGQHFDPVEKKQDWANQVEILHLDTLTTEELAPMPLRIGYSGIGIYNGDIYLIGGKTNDSIQIKNYILKYTPEK